ncbi:MAG: hypothetical protein Q8Q20_05375 [bacterium]|nr:hypothetical protein [bacterium]
MVSDKEEQLTPILKLIRAYQQPDADFIAQPGEPRIQVSRMASRMAFVYEKIRNSLEYQEIHLIRKNAIERIMKRRMLVRIKPSQLAQDLIYELIRARYLPDNEVPEHKIADIGIIINKYFYLFNRVSHYLKGKEKRQTYKWLMGIAAVEIDQALVSPYKTQALAEFMYNTVRPNIVLDEKASELEKNIQIYLAVQRALLRSDQAVLRTHLFRYYNQGWYQASQEQVEKIAQNLPQIRQTIETHIRHPMGDVVFRYLKKYTIYFHVIKDVIAEEPATAESRLGNTETLEVAVKKACYERYNQAKNKLRRGAVRAIIYIFITKMMLAIVLEVPYDLYLHSSIQWNPLAVNVIFHPLLLFLIALTVRIPAEKNTTLVLEGIKSLLQFHDARDILMQRVVKRRLYLTTAFNVIYAITFVITFGAIIYALNRFDFNELSIFLFLLFLTLVSFFGIKIREDAKEYIVVARRDSTIGFLLDLFSMPIVRAGRWISLRSPKINVFIFIFDFIIEAPYKTLVNIFDELTKFIKEKKEEL